MRVQQRIKGPLVMRGPIARGQLVVEGVELKLDLDDALYQQPLGNRGRTADMVDKLPLQVADKATLGAPTIDTIANGPALKFPRIRTNPPPTRH